MWPEVLRQVVQWQIEAFKGKEEEGRVKVVWVREQWHLAVSVRISVVGGGEETAMATGGAVRAGWEDWLPGNKEEGQRLCSMRFHVFLRVADVTTVWKESG
jgi:hypothetical protein